MSKITLRLLSQTSTISLTHVRVRKGIVVQVEDVHNRFRGEKGESLQDGQFLFRPVVEANSDVCEDNRAPFVAVKVAPASANVVFDRTECVQVIPIEEIKEILSDVSCDRNVLKEHGTGDGA